MQPSAHANTHRNPLLNSTLYTFCRKKNSTKKKKKLVINHLFNIMFTVLTPLTDPRSSLDRTLAVVTSTDSHESMSTNKIIYYTGVLFSSQNENKSIIIKKSLSAFMVYYKIPYNYFMTRGLINVPVPETLIIRFSAVVDRAPNEIEHN